ncbi:MAG: hypothetical protein J6W96_06200 [Alphaproteobacteria bacterium]|nr:hypothetical protein [Alphaproteobacteria bacterium]
MIKYNGYILTDKIGGKCAKQTSLFSPAHENFYLYITVTTPEGVKNVYKTSYQYNPGAVKYKSGDGLRAVLMDAESYANSYNLNDFSDSYGCPTPAAAAMYAPDLNTFADWYGYPTPAAARRAFNGCRRAYNFFINAGLTEFDLNKLSELLDNAE